MNLNLQDWEEFVLDKLFTIKKGKRLTSADQEDGENNYIGAIDSNNGIANHIAQKPIHRGNTITINYNGSVGETFYQKDPYWATDDVNALYSKYENFNEKIGLFLVTVIRQEKYKFSYGRKWTVDNMKTTRINLPIKRNKDKTPVIDNSNQFSDKGYIPDWEFMEKYISSLHHKPICTKNVKSLVFYTDNWKFFYLKDICKISMGNKLDYSAMSFDNPKINFIGRSADNEGVMGKVDVLPDITPYSPGCITVALGGSLGSSFVQTDYFYTSQNVSVLEFKKEVTLGSKLFITTCIRNESKYKYFPFGRELNTHIRTDFGFTLPILRDCNGNPIIDTKRQYSKNGYIPDWKYMENYILSLPYGDRIKV